MLVRDFTDVYIKSLKNVRCKVEGIDLNGVKYRGEIAVMNSVLPYKFPPSGAFLFSRSPASDAPNDNNSVSMKIGNSQYSFSLKKSNQDNLLLDLVVPIDDPNREDLAKDRIFFSFSALNAEALWSPIRVYDLASLDMLTGDRGVQVLNFQYQPNDGHAIVEFKFPKDHPFEHEWARVIFGKRGEVLEYEIINRPGSDITVTYFVKINYPEINQTHEGTNRADAASLYPSEFRRNSVMSSTGQPPSAPPELLVRLSDFEYNKNHLEQFTLTHYGIPEPDGTTVLGRPIPYWLFGTIAGGVFLAIGMYLRRNADRVK